MEIFTLSHTGSSNKGLGRIHDAFRHHIDCVSCGEEAGVRWVGSVSEAPAALPGHTGRRGPLVGEAGAKAGHRRPVTGASAEGR